MKGFFSFFAIFSIVLIAFYIAATGQTNRKTHGDSESLLMLADTLHYEKQNVKNLFWNSAVKEDREQDLIALEEGLRSKGTISNFADSAVRIADKCPMPSEKNCVLITNCQGNYCNPDTEAFRATIKKPFATTEFTAFPGEYLVLE